MREAISFILWCALFALASIGGFAWGSWVGQAIVHAKQRKTQPPVCRFCGESDVILVSDEDGTACLPCFRFREALAELERMWNLR
jgi:hypothetical protein